MRLIAVDDERFALKDLIEAIRKAVPEAEIEGFSDPEKALAYAADYDVDVAFLDIEMGEISGLELAKMLKDIHGRTNIVFVTGYCKYAVDAFSIYASGYLMKPTKAGKISEAMEHLRNPIVPVEQMGLRIQTFGNFEVFLDGKPLHFPRSKSKELFAYLIHKRGTGCTTREIAALLFEDHPYTLSLQKQVQTIISAMTKTLKGAGAREYIVRSYNRTAVDVRRIKNCDYYRFLNWDTEAVNEYMGEYMANYSWAEFVIGYLDRKIG